MKKYIRALMQYEEDKQCFKLLCKFVLNHHSNLINDYCSGDLQLPSFTLLKAVKGELSEYTESDKELSILFDNAIKCSKLFYAKTVILLKTSVTGNENFEQIFVEKLQPIGQELINLLINIRYRLRVVKTRKQHQHSTGILQFANKILMVIKPVQRIFFTMRYKVLLLQSSNHYLSKKLYCIALAALLSIVWLANMMLIPNSGTLISAIVNIFFAILLITIAFVAYPINSFGKIDISGKNIVAYKYRGFFNNLLNRKMFNIFAMK